MESKETKTELIYKDEEPFMNFYKFLYDFEWLFLNSTNAHNNNYKDNPDRVNKLCSKLWENNIGMIAERAKHEIQKQIFTNNSNSDKLIVWVENECEKLNTRAKHLSSTYSNVNVMPKFIKFFNTTQVMWNFYDWCIEMKLIYNKTYQGSEYEWINEAKAKGIKIHSAQYYNFINAKKGEKEDKEVEEQRIKDYNYLIGKDTILCPTFEKFKQKLAIEKLNPDKYKYGLWLWDEQVKYSHAISYFNRWGARGGLIDMKDTYAKILALINDLCDAIPVNTHEDITQSIKEPEQSKSEEVSPRQQKNKKYSHKQIAIAYWAMGTLLTKDNAPEILKEYSNNSSVDKLLREQVIKPSELTALTKVKTSDTKHLKCLIAAKELISGTRTVQNKQDAINKIDRIIKAFQTTYENQY